jgi:hypothetical protein
MPTCHPLSTKVRINFEDKSRSLGRYSSLADLDQGILFNDAFSESELKVHNDRRWKLRNVNETLS